MQEAQRVRAAPVVDFLQPLTPAPLQRAGSRNSQGGGGSDDGNRFGGNGGQTSSASRLSQQG